MYEPTEAKHEAKTSPGTARGPADDATCESLPVERRLLPFPKRLTIGEAVLGSTHIHTVVDPQLAAACGSARIHARVEGLLGGEAKNFEVTNGYSVGAMVSPAHHPPVQVRFQPTRVGPQGADLICSIWWQDGAVDKRVIELSAKGVDARAIPAEHQHEPASKPEAEPDVDVKESTRTSSRGSRTRRTKRRAWRGRSPIASSLASRWSLTK